MISLGFNYEIIPEYKEAFIKSTVEGLNDIRKMDGHIVTYVSLDVEDENKMYIHSEWESMDAIRSFMNHPAFKEIQNKTKHMIKGRPVHKILEPVKRKRENS